MGIDSEGMITWEMGSFGFQTTLWGGTLEPAARVTSSRGWNIGHCSGPRQDEGAAGPVGEGEGGTGGGGDDPQQVFGICVPLPKQLRSSN